jgi:hypothetical protein
VKPEIFSKNKIFNITYIPQGTAVKIKNYKEVKNDVEKQFITDWSRKGYAYETYFEGDLYHVVEKKNMTGLEIVRNDRELLPPNYE